MSIFPGMFDQVQQAMQQQGQGQPPQPQPQQQEPGGMFGLGSGLYGGAESGNFMDSFEARMNNPIVAALMSGGGAMMGAAQQGGGLGQAIQAGLGGGVAGAMGAQRMDRQKMEEEERQQMMRQLIERYAQIGVQSPGSPGGLFQSTQPGYPGGAR